MTPLRFFREFGRERAQALRFVCSDMWQPYLKVIAKKAGQALHVLDRFHIMANMNKAIDEVRRREVRDANSSRSMRRSTPGSASAMDGLRGVQPGRAAGGRDGGEQAGDRRDEAGRTKRATFRSTGKVGEPSGLVVIRAKGSASAAPSAEPPTEPTSPTSAPSMRKMRRTCAVVVPTALRMPISRVVCTTETTRTLAMPRATAITMKTWIM
jgi:hypothetical protein